MSGHFICRFKRGAKPTFANVAVSVVGLIIFCAILPCQAMQLHVTLDEMTQQADAIFLGVVVDQQSRYGPNQKMIFTDVFYQVEEVIYRKEKVQSAIHKTVKLTFAGGEVKGETVRVSDVPSFENGSTYLVFTRMDGKTYASPIIGAFQGLFKIISDEVSGVPYALTYGGRYIVEIKEGDIVTGPPVAKIVAGAIEERADTSTVKFYDVPPQPVEETGQTDAEAHVSAAPFEISNKIMTLDEFIAEIKKRL